MMQGSLLCSMTPVDDGILSLIMRKMPPLYCRVYQTNTIEYISDYELSQCNLTSHLTDCMLKFNTLLNFM